MMAPQHASWRHRTDPSLGGKPVGISRRGDREVVVVTFGGLDNLSEIAGLRRQASVNPGHRGAGGRKGTPTTLHGDSVTGGAACRYTGQTVSGLHKARSDSCRFPGKNPTDKHQSDAFWRRSARRTYGPTRVWPRRNRIP